MGAFACLCTHMYECVFWKYKAYENGYIEL